MLRKIVFLTVLTGIAFSAAGFAEDKMPARDLEWSDYGLNFEWFKDKQALKGLNLTETQEQEIGKLAEAAAVTAKNESELRNEETMLRNLLQFRSSIRLSGQAETINMSEIESSVEKINSARNEIYKSKMLAKANLKNILSEEQRTTLRNNFKKKEDEEKAKFIRSNMGEQGGPGGGGMGGRGGPGGGMPPGMDR